MLAAAYAAAFVLWILWRVAIEEHRPHEWQSQWATGLAAVSSVGVYLRRRWIRNHDQYRSPGEA